MRSRGFTLVELLVVIAIITILASMLLPSLEHSLQEARKAACSSQLRQLSTFFSFYRDDSAGFLPESGESPFMHDIRGGNAVGVIGYCGLLFRQGYFKDSRLMDCPSLQAADAYLKAAPSTYAHRYIGYVNCIPNSSVKNHVAWNPDAMENKLFPLGWYAGMGNVKWRALAACTATVDAATLSMGYAGVNWPHSARGENVLRLDGSVWFLKSGANTILPTPVNTIEYYFFWYYANK